MGEELKPCPFCGSEAKLYNYLEEAGAECQSCKAQILRTHRDFGDGAGLGDASKAWNTRATISAPESVTSDELDIDDVRELFEQWAKGRDLTPNTWGSTSYENVYVDNDWLAWVAAWKALAARAEAK